MKIKLLIILLTLFSVSGFSQIVKPIRLIGSRWDIVKAPGILSSDSAIIFPKDTIKLQFTDRAIASKNSIWYGWTGISWQPYLGALPSTFRDTINYQSPVEYDIPSKTVRINADTLNAWGSRTGLSNLVKGLKFLGDTSKAMTIGSNGPQNGTVSMVSGTVYFVDFYLEAPAILSGVTVIFNNPPSFTPTGYNGVGLYFVSSSGTYTLLESSTSDGTAFNHSYNPTNMAFSSTYSAASGMYAIGFLYQATTATTTPSLWYGLNLGSPNFGASLPNGLYLFTTYTGQTILPTTLSASSMSSHSTFPFFMKVY